MGVFESKPHQGWHQHGLKQSQPAQNTFKSIASMKRIQEQLFRDYYKRSSNFGFEQELFYRHFFKIFVDQKSIEVDIKKKKQSHHKTWPKREEKVYLTIQGLKEMAKKMELNLSWDREGKTKQRKLSKIRRKQKVFRRQVIRRHKLAANIQTRRRPETRWECFYARPLMNQ